MDLLGLFGRKAKNSKAKRLKHDFKPVFEKSKLQEVFAGKLCLPTGKIVAGDPFMIHGHEPFGLQVAPGNYPVKLLIHRVDEGHYRIAYARLQLAERPAMSWTMALTEDITDGQINDLQDGEFFGYLVDAGLGCFTDAETNRMFSTAMDGYYEENPTKNYYDDILAEEFKTVSGSHPLSRDLGDWNNHFPVQGKPNNVIMFTSGWGDGSYASYWGKDAKGQVVELLTDFFVLPE